MITIKFNRKQYMSGECDFWTYEKQFVTAGVIELVKARIGEKRIKASTDAFLNDIPLKEWDAMHQAIGAMVGRHIGASNASTSSNIPPNQSLYSLSDTVCVAKAAAKIIKGE